MAHTYCPLCVRVYANNTNMNGLGSDSASVLRQAAAAAGLSRDEPQMKNLRAIDATWNGVTERNERLIEQ